MKLRIENLFRLALALGSCSLALNTQAAAAPKAPAKPKSPELEVAAVQESPKSVFTIPVSRKDGRNPFFPDANPSKELTRISPTNAVVDTSVFVLNGLTSLPKRTAIINNRTFEPGEEGEVKLANGSRLLIKCVDIRDDAAAILVGGQRKELKLRIGL